MVILAAKNTRSIMASLERTSVGEVRTGSAYSIDPSIYYLLQFSFH